MVEEISLFNWNIRLHTDPHAYSIPVGAYAVIKHIVCNPKTYPKLPRVTTGFHIDLKELTQGLEQGLVPECHFCKVAMLEDTAQSLLAFIKVTELSSLNFNT